MQRFVEAVLVVGGLARHTRREADNRAWSVQSLGSNPLTRDRTLREQAPEAIFGDAFTRPEDSIFAVVPIAEGGSYNATDRLFAGYGMVAGPDPSLLTQPSRAIKRALDAANLPLASVDLFELNEAFAAVGLASMRDLGISDDIANVNGGAIALGHPLAATGVRLTLTLARELQRSGQRYGIASACVGGGQGMALLIENPSAWNTRRTPP